MTPLDLIFRIFGRPDSAEAERRRTSARNKAIDELEDAYVAWRETCSAVQSAYERWTASELPERDFAFAGYGAALQQEEHAAHVYRSRIDLITG